MQDLESCSRPFFNRVLGDGHLVQKIQVGFLRTPLEDLVVLRFAILLTLENTRQAAIFWVVYKYQQSVLGDCHPPSRNVLVQYVSEETLYAT